MTTDNELLYTVLGYITDVFLCLSIVGSFLTAFTFMFYYKLRTYPIRLIVYLCMSILFAQFFFAISFRSSRSLFCIPAGLLLHYFFLADIFWTFCVSFNFYQMIVKRNRETESYEKYYHMIAWGLPMIITIFCAGFKKYVNRGEFCYLASDYSVYFAFFIPGCVVVCANCVVYFFIAREIHNTLKHAPKTSKRETSKEFRVYMSIFFCIGSSWLFGFIMAFFKKNSPISLIFLILFSVTTSLQGFLIFVTYCLNYKILAHYSRTFTSIGLSFFKRWENIDGTQFSGPTGTTDNSSTNLNSNSTSTSTSTIISNGGSNNNLNSSTGNSSA